MSSNPDSKKIISYKDAGVDIIAGDQLIEKIKPFAKKTMRNGVLGGLGGFGSMFEIPKNYKNPVLVSGTDGVGTKLKLAFETNNPYCPPLFPSNTLFAILKSHIC